MSMNVPPHPSSVQQFKASVGDLQGTLKTLDHTVSVLEEALKQKKAALRDRRLHNARADEHIAVVEQDVGRLMDNPDGDAEPDPQYTTEQVGCDLLGSDLPLSGAYTGMIRLRRNVRRLEQLDECCAMALTLSHDIRSYIDKANGVHGGMWHEPRTYRQAVHATKQQQVSRMLTVKLQRLEQLVQQHPRQRQATLSTLAHLRVEQEQLMQKQCHSDRDRQRILAELKELHEAETAAAKSHSRKMLQLQLNYTTMLKQLDLYHSELGKTWQRLAKHIDVLDPPLAEHYVVL